MNYFRKKTLKKVKKYNEEIEFLHLFRVKQEKIHGEKYTNSWLGVITDFRVSKLFFKKKILKRFLKI